MTSQATLHVLLGRARGGVKGWPHFKYFRAGFPFFVRVLNDDSFYSKSLECGYFHELARPVVRNEKKKEKPVLNFSPNGQKREAGHQHIETRRGQLTSATGAN